MDLGLNLGGYTLAPNTIKYRKYLRINYIMPPP